MSELLPMQDRLEFEVRYSRNCDGGKQEFQVARDAVLAIFGADVLVTETCVDHYPITVVVTEKRSGAIVWSGDQRGLFRKYGHRAMPELKRKLSDFKMQLEQGDQQAKSEGSATRD
mmetsp:Transcript_8495/g.22356  ORF Transcript_8495/g.22356 Transcript_8495/m.22356 type:complete len:116 (-) Transcript_8495:277-624(-)